MQYFSDMSQASSRIEWCLGVSGLLAQFDDRIDDVGLYAVVFDLVWVLGKVKELFVGFIVFQDVLEALWDFPKDKTIDLTLLFCRQIAIVWGDVYGSFDLLLSFFATIDRGLVVTVLHSGAVSWCLKGDLVSCDFLVEPFKSNNKFFGQAEVGALELGDAGFIFR